MATAEKFSDKQILLQGKLLFSVIVTLRKQIELMLESCSGEIDIDFSGITSVDSSALSFWLCCQRFAEKKGIVLNPINVPVEMQSFAGLVGLDNQLCD